MKKVALSLILLSALLTTTSLWADDLGKLRAKLARENDPSKRAKISVKIGRELLQQTKKLYRDETFPEARAKLEEYLTVVTTAFEGLQESRHQARRKPRGFKELEIHLRKSRRTLTDVARAVPFDVREPVQKTVEKIKTMRTELLHSLMDFNQQKREGG